MTRFTRALGTALVAIVACHGSGAEAHTGPPVAPRLVVDPSLDPGAGPHVDPSADPVWRWRPYIAQASHRFGIPEVWIARVIQAESGGQTRLGGRPITSCAGAMGLMQLMPATWASMRDRLKLGDDPHDPRDNILAGTFYLRLLLDRFGFPGLFAAYHAGPTRLAQYLSGAAPLPRATRHYVMRIAGRTIDRHSDRFAADGTGAARSPPIPSDELEAITARLQVPRDDAREMSPPPIFYSLAAPVPHGNASRDMGASPVPSTIDRTSPDARE
ncbi:Transglycosylase SLT domain-containing protein [Sphingomonas laterariae]|uniref:Transglycosylase SLT domain-containing protein n=1 Tax=Edaphosphingomonas laterariae TaxID=861865 RepID=A0A239I3W6_9SPHN|nr:lytic transglycosylase domain-containing protein [Sphingomonas laterariae]SNS88280.1 Transglycosylase SLT domain-containing protein [Sphingomonas laterariae]